ncbi:MAG: Rrf2 family transcriptional regulator [Candidatus Omnitrophica bacterium]|nr:Rrf2 family transcriptional regulator [Candidatus Omnitrophota bacterium]
MRITYRTDYALKTILELGLHFGQDSAPTIHEIAERLDIPEKFLEQILLDLKRGGFVESRRGKIGGYFLSQKPREITLGKVIRFIEGPIEPVACVGHNYKGCQDIRSCVFRNIWQRVAESTAKIIDGITFEDLVKQVKGKEAVSSYSI